MYIYMYIYIYIHTHTLCACIYTYTHPKKILVCISNCLGETHFTIKQLTLIDEKVETSEVLDKVYTTLQHNLMKPPKQSTIANPHETDSRRRHTHPTVY